MVQSSSSLSRAKIRNSNQCGYTRVQSDSRLFYEVDHRYSKPFSRPYRRECKERKPQRSELMWKTRHGDYSQTLNSGTCFQAWEDAVLSRLADKEQETPQQLSIDRTVFSIQIATLRGLLEEVVGESLHSSVGIAISDGCQEDIAMGESWLCQLCSYAS